MSEFQLNTEGLWWKQEANVNGFVALTNPGSAAINANLTVTDNQGASLSQTAVTVTPHGTKMIELAGLPPGAGTAGGVSVQFTGAANALLVSGGLRDEAVGYSANVIFAPTPQGPGQSATVSYAAVGLMTGVADPMMRFPNGTIFVPYVIARNISSQPVTVTPNLWWMEGGAAKSAALPAVALAAREAKNLDLPALISQAGLKDYHGNLNVVLEVAGNVPRGAVLLSTGSVDQKNTYVFEVAPEAVKESIAKNLSYWSTANGDDTMVTLWNPADEGQDFLFTLFYVGGHYRYPLHLEARATMIFNVSQIVESSLPDDEGNVIPAGIHEGSAELSGSQGEAEHILVSMDAGTYNVVKATCGTWCKTCQGAVDSWITDNPFATPLGMTHQLTYTVQNHSGTQVNDTAAGSWSSTQPSVATVSANGGLVSPVSVGALTVLVDDTEYPLYTSGCYGYAFDCPLATGTHGSDPGKVQVPTSLALSLGDKVTYNGNHMIECNGTDDGPRWGYSRCATFSLLDQDGAPITIGSFTATETVSTVSSNPAGLLAKVGGGSLVSGQFKDFWAFVTTSSPAPPPGQYVKVRQRIKITSNNGDGTIYKDIRINCLDFESSDVTVTDITSNGTCQ